jgi:hypothetical protein
MRHCRVRCRRAGCVGSACAICSASDIQHWQAAPVDVRCTPTGSGAAASLLLAGIATGRAQVPRCAREDAFRHPLWLTNHLAEAQMAIAASIVEARAIAVVNSNNAAVLSFQIGRRAVASDGRFPDRYRWQAGWCDWRQRRHRDTGRRDREGRAGRDHQAIAAAAGTRSRSAPAACPLT